MTEQEWRNQLKEGDLVFVSRPYGQAPVPCKVSRTTKTRIFIRVNENCETAYVRETGREFGGDKWAYESLRQPTEEVINEHKCNVLKHKVKELLKELQSALPNDREELQTWFDLFSTLKAKGELEWK